MKATIRTTHPAPVVVAEALRPDNTDDISTTVVEDRIETTITRDAPGSVQATIDDYLVNLILAEETRQRTDIESMTTTEHTERDQ